MSNNFPNIRPNLRGDYPVIHPSALIDPSSQIIGNVRIGRNVFIAPLAVIRADEPGPDGTVAPIVLEEECNVQDGVIIHSHGGEIVRIGTQTSVGHGATIHGPCEIGENCFLAMRATLYRVNIGDWAWIGMNASIMQVSLDSYTHVPAGSVIRSGSKSRELRFISEKERVYMQNVLQATNRLREDYLRIRGIPAM